MTGEIVCPYTSGTHLAQLHTMEKSWNRINSLTWLPRPHCFLSIYPVIWESGLLPGFTLKFFFFSKMTVLIFSLVITKSNIEAVGKRFSHPSLPYPSFGAGGVWKGVFGKHCTQKWKRLVFNRWFYADFLKIKKRKKLKTINFFLQFSPPMQALVPF